MNFFAYREQLQHTDRAVFRNLGSYQPEKDHTRAGMKSMRIPTPRQVTEAFEKSGYADVHPRILGSKADFDRIRQNKDKEPWKHWIDILKTRADEYLAADFAPWVDARGVLSEKKDYLNPCRTLKQRVQTLAMLWQITGEQRYAKRAADELLNFSTYATYYEEHFLNVAEACMAFALGYDWMYDYLTPAQKDTLAEAMFWQCMNKAYLPMQKCLLFAGKLSNWNQVCNGGIALGALAIFERMPEICSDLVSFALQNEPRSIAYISPDGAYPEGPTYWDYGMAYTVYFMSTLQTVFGDDFGLSEIEGMKETVTFPMYCTAPEGTHATFADCGHKAHRGSPQVYWLAKRYGQPAYSWYTQTYYPDGGSSESGVYELLWFDPQVLSTPQAEHFPVDMVYDGEENMAMFRKDWGKDGIYGFFKGGDNQSSHGCLDIGQFVIHNFGMRWAADLTKEFYHVTDYWVMNTDAGRWLYYRKRAEGHNTLLLNPTEKPDQDRNAVCTISQFGTSPQCGYALCDMTAAYPDAQKALRGFAILDDRRAFLVQDEVSCKAPGVLWWRMHTEAEEISVQGNRAVLRRGGHTMTVTLQTPEDAQLFVTEAQPLPTSPKTAENTPNPEMKVLCLRLENVSDITLRAVFTFDGSSFMPAQLPLCRWSELVEK